MCPALLNKLPRAGEKCWQQHQHQLPWNRRNTCGGPGADPESEQCADGCFGSKALTLRCAGDGPLSAKTLQTACAWNISPNENRIFGCLCLLVSVWFGFVLCSHCRHRAAVAEAETSLLPCQQQLLSGTAHKR